MSTNAVKNARFGKLACAVAGLTILILMGNAGILTHRLLTSDAEAQQSETDQPRAASVVVLAEAPKPKIPVIEVKMVPPEEAKLQYVESQAEAQEAPVKVAASRVAPHPPLVVEPPLHDFLGRTLVTAAAIFAVGIVAPVIFAISLFGLLRRHSQRFGPLIRIEYAGGAPVIAAPAPVAEAAPANYSRFADVRASTAPTHSAESFDTGSTFDQERQLKEKRLGQAEEAVLQHLFENNLKLYEQIDLANDKDPGAKR